MRAMNRVSLSIDSIEKVDEDVRARIREAAMDVRLQCVREINRLCESLDVNGPPIPSARVVEMLVELWGRIMDGEQAPPADWMLLLMSAQTQASFLGASAEDAVRRLGSRPVLVVHGDDDLLMPVSHAQRLYNAAAGPRTIWFGPGPHSNIVTTDPSGYADRLFAFLERTVGSIPAEMN